MEPALEQAGSPTLFFLHENEMHDLVTSILYSDLHPFLAVKMAPMHLKEEEWRGEPLKF